MVFLSLGRVESKDLEDLNSKQFFPLKVCFKVKIYLKVEEGEIKMCQTKNIF